jgi:catechol 2,3-dioxygenase
MQSYGIPKIGSERVEAVGQEERGEMTTADEPIKLSFSHMGVTVRDLPLMEAFYLAVMGFIVTDRGSAGGGMDLVFLSRTPNDHHQIILGTGRPENLPPNTINPQFGPSINQISFKMPALEEMRKVRAKLEANGAQNILAANHGNAWSLYAHDPEGNNLEFYVESPWYVAQPMFEMLDLTKNDEDILTETRELCASNPGFEEIASWRARMGEMMVGL